MTRILNNDYLLSKVMSFLSFVLIFLGFTSCGKEEIIQIDEPWSMPCAYGPPIPTIHICADVSGIVQNEDGEPVSNIGVKITPCYINYSFMSLEAFDYGNSNNNGEYESVAIYALPFSYNIGKIKELCPQYRVVAFDDYGVYENDTLFVDNTLSSLVTDSLNYSTATANFTLHKKKN